MTKRDDELRASVQAVLQTPVPAVDERLRTLLQKIHDKHVWEYIERIVVGWRTGTMVDHDVKRLAQRLDVIIQRPLFLSPLYELLKAVEPDGSTDSFIRASGEMLCPVCKSPYRQHPPDRNPANLTTIDGGEPQPYLRRLCTGLLVKL